MKFLIKTLGIFILLGGLIPLQAQIISSKDKTKNETTKVSREKDLSDYSQVLKNLKIDYRLGKTHSAGEQLQQLTKIMEREILRTEKEFLQLKKKQWSKRKKNKIGNSERAGILENRLKDENRIYTIASEFDYENKKSPKALMHLQNQLGQFEKHMKASLNETTANTVATDPPKGDGGASILNEGGGHISASSTITKGNRKDKVRKKRDRKPKVKSRAEIAGEIDMLSTKTVNAIKNNDLKKGLKYHSKLIKKMNLIIATNQKQLQKMHADGKTTDDKEYKVLSFKTQKLTSIKNSCISFTLPEQMDELEENAKLFNHYIR